MTAGATGDGAPRSRSVGYARLAPLPGGGAPPEVVAVVAAAVELVRRSAPPPAPRPEPRASAWRFSGRWWTPPAPLRRQRPVLFATPASARTPR
jgi:hypothetical protein